MLGLYRCISWANSTPNLFCSVRPLFPFRKTQGTETLRPSGALCIPGMMRTRMTRTAATAPSRTGRGSRTHARSHGRMAKHAREGMDRECSEWCSQTQPLFSLAFSFSPLGSLVFPSLRSFVGEFLVVLAGFQRYALVVTPRAGGGAERSGGGGPAVCFGVGGRERAPLVGSLLGVPPHSLLQPPPASPPLPLPRPRLQARSPPLCSPMHWPKQVTM